MRQKIPLGIVACLLWAFASFNEVSCYNPYAYSARFLPNTMSADSYSAMGDIDWAKRSSYGRLHDLLNQNFGYASMADADWGWKKRSDLDSSLEEEEDIPQSGAVYLNEAPKRAMAYKSYKYRQPYMLARYNRDAYIPSQGYARYTPVARPQTRKLGNRQYAYASMADMDWGWKKRSQLPALTDVDYDLDDLTEVEKKNVASLARYNSYPGGRTLKFQGKRSTDESEDLDKIEEEKRHLSSMLDKRHVSSLHRPARSFSSLARNGGLRSTSKQ